LSKGAIYLDPIWGLQSLADWAKQKFGQRIDPQELVEKSRAEIRARILGEIRQQYRTKEAEFPVTIAMARYMADRGAPQMGGAKYDREGLLRWYQNRFGGAVITEETFRTESRAKLHEKLLEISRQAFPGTPQEQIDTKLEESFEGAKTAEE